MSTKFVIKPVFEKNRVEINPNDIMNLFVHPHRISVLSHLIEEPGTILDLLKRTGLSDGLIYQSLKILKECNLITSKKIRIRKLHGMPLMMFYESTITRMNLCADRFGVFAEFVQEGGVKRTDYITLQPKSEDDI